MGEFFNQLIIIPVTFAMQWCNENVFFSYVLTIVAFTALIKLLTLPIDIKQRANMAKMTTLQPELQALQKRYASNPETLQKKTSELYKANNYNQFAGCLPMILMMVFFMVFVNAAGQWAKVNTINLYLNPSVEHFQQFNWLWVNNIFMPDSGAAQIVMPFEQFTAIKFQELVSFYDAATIQTLKNVTEAQYNAAMQPIYAAMPGIMNGWFVLPLISGASMLLSNLLTQKVTPQPKDPQQANTAGMNKSMMYVMAAVSVWVCITSNAAFAIYWIASNIFGILTTLALNYKTLLKPEGSAKEASK